MQVADVPVTTRSQVFCRDARAGVGVGAAHVTVGRLRFAEQPDMWQAPDGVDKCGAGAGAEISEQRALEDESVHLVLCEKSRDAVSVWYVGEHEVHPLDGHREFHAVEGLGDDRQVGKGVVHAYEENAEVAAIAARCTAVDWVRFAPTPKRFVIRAGDRLEHTLANAGTDGIGSIDHSGNGAHGDLGDGSDVENGGFSRAAGEERFTLWLWRMKIVGARKNMK